MDVVRHPVADGRGGAAGRSQGPGQVSVASRARPSRSALRVVSGWR